MKLFQEYLFLVPTKRCSCKIYTNMDCLLVVKNGTVMKIKKRIDQKLGQLFANFQKKLVNRTMHQETNVRATCVKPTRSAINIIIL